MTSPAGSLWLQDSITVVDPLPNDNGISPPRPDPTKQPATQTATPAAVDEEACATTPVAPVSPAEASVATDEKLPAVPAPAQVTECGVTPRAQTRSGAAEMDLTKMVLDTSLFASAQRASSFRYSMRPSVANVAGGVTALEYDELRSRCSQLKRELIKVGDVQKDLDFARFELTRCKEELKMTQSSNDRLRADLEEANERLDGERRARGEAESKVSSEAVLHTKEIDFLKSQIEDLRQQNSRRLHELSEEQEQEYERRIEAMRADLSAVIADHEQAQQALAESQAERDLAVQQRQDITEELRTARVELGEAKQRAETLRTEMEREAQRHGEKLDASRREFESELDAQKKIYQERLSELSAGKDALKKESEDEARAHQDKLRQLREELAVTRQRCTELEQDAHQTAAERERQVGRLIEEHRLALSEKELQMEAAVREARSSKVSIDEENYSLRRKASQLSEELSTVSAVLAQRERERDALQHKLAEIKEEATQKDMEHARLLADLDMHAAGLDETTERLARLQQERDELEEGYAGDLRAAKDRIRELEQKIMKGETEISQLRRETMRSQDSGLSTVKDLRLENDALRGERDQLRLEVADKQHLEVMLREAQAHLKESQRHNDDLQVELKAVAGRSVALERRLDGALRHQISQTCTSPGNAPSAAATASSAANPRSTNSSRKVSPRQQQQPLRSVSCTNRLSPAPGTGSLKRARTEDARVVATSGFDGTELLMALKQLPSVAVAECQSNVPVPSNLTHLITNGQATVKLLTALVRGCWVLPSQYVMDSLAQHTWLPEGEYGFQHEEPPLQKRHVAMTDSFKALNFYSTADLLLREGGGILEKDPEEADLVLCASRELDAVPRGISWEGFVELIYPVKIKAETA